MRQFVRTFTALTVLFAVAPVLSANLPTHDCKQLGATQMSDDQANIIACTLVTGTTGTAPACANSSGAFTGACKWKSMSGGEAGLPQGALCGQAEIYLQQVCVGGCTVLYALTSQKPCLGVNLFTPIYGVSNPKAGWHVREYSGSVTFSPNCPSGYSPVLTGNAPPMGVTGYNDYFRYSCIKN